MTDQPRDKAEKFLNVANQFKLGMLPTEQRHPLTRDLADLSTRDVPGALRILKDIDMSVVATIAEKEPELTRLRAAIDDTLRTGNRVFFYGCGATGRLSLSIEYIWRSLHPTPPDSEKVHGFMSGGDLALVHSIENFEDHPEYGARQVREVGFGPNDLLVCCTEGGETPSVIGAAEEAARISARKPFFLYCNPDDDLRQVERSQRVLDNPGIEKICLFVGPMVLSGSTRLQASTALMLGAGAALTGVTPQDIVNFHDFLQNTDLSFLSTFVGEEARIYQRGDFILYETDAYGVTILTDTTERAPTFSLPGFENQNDPQRLPSLCYFRLPETATAAEAWEKILLRPPETIEWDELKAVAGRDRILGFDFSAAALGQREALVAPHKLHRFEIRREGDVMTFALSDLRHEIDVSTLHPLFEHLLLKTALNMHSTLVMGRLGRYESNVMTWVKPSNYKLIDRAIRYVDYLMQHRHNRNLNYDDICYQLFDEMSRLKPGESVVLKTCESLSF